MNDASLLPLPRGVTSFRLPIAAAVVGALALVALFVVVPTLPFQDLPQHDLVLRASRALREGATSPFLEVSPHVTFAYSGYLRLARLVDPLVGTGASLTLVTAAGAFLLPFAVARLAQVTGGSAAWAFVMALPLTLAWHVRMGFVAYSLGLDTAIFWIAATKAYVDRPSRPRGAAVVLLAIATYLGHPLPWGVAVCGAAAYGLGASTRRRGAPVLAGAVGATLVLVAWDVTHFAFRQVPETRVTWEPSPLAFRPATTALAHLVTRSFGIPTATGLAPIALLALGLVVALPAARRARLAPTDAVTTRLAWAAAWLAFLAPTSYKITWLMGDRLAVFAVVFAMSAASRKFVGKPEWGPSIFVVVGALGATTVAAVDVSRQAATVAHVTLPRTSRFPPGRYLTYRLTDCTDRSYDPVWGDVDPLRSAWAWGADLDAMTPYAFGFSRYLSVVFKGDVYASRLRAPHEWNVNEVRTKSSREACEAFDGRQVDKARRTQFDGVIVFGNPDRMPDVARRVGAAVAFEVAPGVVAFSRNSASPTR
ncbi:MAG: hypothetical protein U0169_06490 [Polyangiaceae bacterium]